MCGMTMIGAAVLSCLDDSELDLNVHDNEA